MDNRLRLFYGSCFAIITTAFSFTIRAGVLAQLGVEFNLTAEQLGVISSMWFFGFPISMVFFGLTYHTIGPKRIMQFAFFAHTLGILLTIYSGGYVGLMISTLFIGIGNGCTEAACNPMIADGYSGKQMNILLNRFHMWFPGGIFLGALLSFLIATYTQITWQVQIWIILIPTVIYAYLFFGQTFPAPKTREVGSLKENLKGMASPVYIFIAVCMALTAISEFVPNQWVQLTLAKSGAHPMLILALISGIMAVGRYFGGEFVHKFDQTGVLLGSAVLATLGIFLLSTLTGVSTYFAAVVFALGITYFWPNNIGLVAEKLPKTGALGMSVLGAIGLFMTANMQPIFGGWIDAAREKATGMGLTGDALELAAGQATLQKMIAFPATLIVLYTILFFWLRGKKSAGAGQH